MRWDKLGHVYVPDGSLPWATAYAFPPTPHLVDADTIRIYCAFCDERTVGRAAYVDVDAHDPTRVLRVSQRPVLDIGAPGTFDENGVVPTCVLEVSGRLHMYYSGFQLGRQVRFYQFLGLAVSEDGGETFQRAGQAPVLDRSDAELVNRTSAFVLHDGGAFRMWYAAGSEWTEIDGKPFPMLSLRCLESHDGVTWDGEGRDVIELDAPDEHAVGRPWVLRRADGGYRMFYSVRRRSSGYRMGCADSSDGASWRRRDDAMNLDVSDRGWDSEMVAYAGVVEVHGRTFAFYNGNGSGRTGFGVAELVQS